MFNDNVVLQEVIYLLKLNNGRLNLLKLIKELYLADRLSIKEREWSISGDTYFSMKNGPILSDTLNLLNDKEEFSEYIDREPTDYYPNIILKKELDDYDYLSDKDKEYLETISNRFKNNTEWELVDYTHKLEEWTSVKKSERKKIKFTDILAAVGYSSEEISKIKSEQDSFKNFMA